MTHLLQRAAFPGVLGKEFGKLLLFHVHHHHVMRLSRLSLVFGEVLARAEGGRKFFVYNFLFCLVVSPEFVDRWD